jgi:hypothetical protein
MKLVKDLAEELNINKTTLQKNLPTRNNELKHYQLVADLVFLPEQAEICLPSRASNST